MDLRRKVKSAKTLYSPTKVHSLQIAAVDTAIYLCQRYIGHVRGPVTIATKDFSALITLTYLYIYNMYTQRSPSGCVRREIPRVAQVEKGHEGNKAVLIVTGYIYMFEETWNVSFMRNK